MSKIRSVKISRTVQVEQPLMPVLARPVQPRVYLTRRPILSPYVIYLERHDEHDLPARALPNLLGEPCRLHIELALLDPAHNQITIRHQDLISQLRGHDQTGAAREAFANGPQLPTRREVSEALEAYHLAHPIEEPRFATLPLSHFHPGKRGEDVLAMLDLPDEDEPEAELVELDVGAALVAARRAGTLLRPFGTSDGLTSPAPTASRIPWWVELALPHGWQRALSAFVLVSFVFVLPLHAMGLVNEAKHAVGQAQASVAELASEPILSAELFARAAEELSALEASLGPARVAAHVAAAVLPPSSGSIQTAAVAATMTAPLSRISQELTSVLYALETHGELPISEKLTLISETAQAVLPDLKRVTDASLRLDASSLPSSAAPVVAQLQTQLPALTEALVGFVAHAPALEDMLGAHGKRRYLLVFQNSNELRATGGFMGSYAELDVEDGAIVRLWIPEGGTYDLEAGLRTQLLPPTPLLLLNDRWEFQDANWFSDFPTSARQIIQFYEDAGGPSVDGVMAINAQVIADLLAVLGPVAVPEFDRVFDAENFLFEAQKLAEFEYAAYEDTTDDRNEPAPKAFLGPLASELMDRLFHADAKTLFAVGARLGSSVLEKHIQTYFTDQGVQAHARALGWTGETKPATQDYLSVISSNIGGGKTNAVLEEQIAVSATVSEDGSVVNTVQITRTHHGQSGALFAGINHVSYVRLLVPRGAELLSADGFNAPPSDLFLQPNPHAQWDDDVRFPAASQDVHPQSGTVISEELGKTIFGNWIQTAPGATTITTITYRLPFRLDLRTSSGLLSAASSILGRAPEAPYTLLWQGQSGVPHRQAYFTLRLPSSASLTWSSTNTNKTDLPAHRDSLYAALVSAVER